MCFKKIIFAAALGVLFTAPVPAQTNQVRLLTLQQAIQLALEHNLEVQIEQVNPEIACFNLKSLDGYYDPTFSVGLKQSFNSDPGGFDSETGLQVPGNETWVESLQPGLSGTLPTGLKYDIGGDLANRSSGTSSGIATSITTNGSVVTTNVFVQTRDRGFQYRPTVGIDLAQPLLKDFWIDITRQKILLEKKNLKYTELGVRQKIMDVVTRVEDAYYELIFAIDNVKVQEKALELAERLLSENRRRVEVGALAPLDEKQAESQAAGSRADLLRAHSDLDARQNVLKNLITDEYKNWYGKDIQPAEKLVAIQEKFNLLESWQLGMTQRPDLLQARVDIEKRDIVLRYQRNQLFPQLDLIGSYGRNGLDSHWGGALTDIREETNPRFSYGILFSVPLSNRGPKNLYRASKAEKEQALLGLKQLEQNIMVQIDDAVKVAQTSFQRVDATKKARLYAEAALEAEQKKLENGKSTSFVVLQLQRDLTTSRSQEIRALADYNKALAQLSFDEGTVLERNHLALDVK